MSTPFPHGSALAKQLQQATRPHDIRAILVSIRTAGPAASDLMPALVQRAEQAFNEGSWLFGHYLHTMAAIDGGATTLKLAHDALDQTLSAGPRRYKLGIVRALGTVTSPRAVTAACQCLLTRVYPRVDSPDEWTEVIEALAKLAGPGCFDALVAAYEAHPGRAYVVLQAFGALGDRRATPLLVAALRSGDWRHVVLNALTQLADPSAAPALLDLLEEASDQYIPNFVQALLAVDLPAPTLARALVRVLNGQATPTPARVLALQNLAGLNLDDASISAAIAACRNTWLETLASERTQHVTMWVRRAAHMVDTATAALLARDGWRAVPADDVATMIARQVEILSILHDVDTRLVGQVLSSHVNTALLALTAVAQAFQSAPLKVLASLPWLDAGYAVAAPAGLEPDGRPTNETLRTCARALSALLLSCHGETWRGLEKDLQRALKLAREGDVEAARQLASLAERNRRPALHVVAKLLQIVGRS